MSPAGCPDCGKPLAADGKCVACNLPPRHAALRLTGLFLGLLVVLGVAYLMYSR